MALPDKVNVLGVEYTIEYCEKPSDVDLFKRSSLWGQRDFWTRTIRIYKGNRNEADIWQNILHEVLHAIADQLHLKYLKDWQKDENHNELDLVATGMFDVLTRNGWLIK